MKVDPVQTSMMDTQEQWLRNVQMTTGDSDGALVVSEDSAMESEPEELTDTCHRLPRKLSETSKNDVAKDEYLDDEEFEDVTTAIAMNKLQSEVETQLKEIVQTLDHSPVPATEDDYRLSRDRLRAQSRILGGLFGDDVASLLDRIVILTEEISKRDMFIVELKAANINCLARENKVKEVKRNYEQTLEAIKKELSSTKGQLQQEMSNGETARAVADTQLRGYQNIMKLQKDEFLKETRALKVKLRSALSIEKTAREQNDSNIARIRELEADLLSTIQIRDLKIQRYSRDRSSMEQLLAYEKHQTERKDVTINAIKRDHESTKAQLEEAKELLGLYERYENHLAKRRAEMKADNQRFAYEIECLKMREDARHNPRLLQENAKWRMQLNACGDLMITKMEEIKKLESSLHNLSKEVEIKKTSQDREAQNRESVIAGLWAENRAHNIEKVKTAVVLSSVMNENQTLREKTTNMEANLATLIKENEELRQIKKVTESEVRNLVSDAQNVEWELEDLKDSLAKARDNFLGKIWKPYGAIKTILSSYEDSEIHDKRSSGSDIVRDTFAEHWEIADAWFTKLLGPSAAEDCAPRCTDAEQCIDKLEKTIQKLDSRIGGREKQLQLLKTECEEQLKTLKTLMERFSKFDKDDEIEAHERMIQGILIDFDLKSDTLASITTQLQTLEGERREKEEVLKEQLQKRGQAGHEAL